MRSDVVNTLLRTAVGGVCGLLLVAGAVEAQTTVPGAPTIDTVTAGRNTSGLTLTVTWTAPTNTGGSAITAYDVRSIKTADDETNDANWTEEDNAWTTGSLNYTISGLTESTQYDVQVRAVNATGDGAWSGTETGTTLDHGDSTSTATALTLDTPQDSVIEPGTDVDYFTFTLTQKTGLLIWTAGDLDTVGELQDSMGTALVSNDDNPFSEDDPLSSAPLNFFVWKTLAAGTYYIKVSSYGGATGAYVLHTRAIVDSSGTANAHEITLGSDGIAVERGILDPVIGLGPSRDHDYFKLTLSATTEVIIHTSGIVENPRIILLQSNGTTEITRNSSSSLWPHHPTEDTPLVRHSLDAGTYYIEIESWSGGGVDDSGVYNLHVNTVTDPGDTTATATPLRFGEARGGDIASTSDVDHFRFEVAETTDILVRGVGVSISGELLDADGNAVTVSAESDSSSLFSADGLTVGTYYIKVTASGTGDYTILALADPSYYRFVALCEGVATPASITDPLYGCQWHLNNAGQRKGGVSDEDINVEAVWAAGTLGAGINVAVVDNGMDADHEDLSANVEATRNHDYTAEEGEDPTDIYNPDNNHGTAVAGIIAARDNSLGVRGVAPRATVYGYNCIQALNATDANIANAMQRNLVETHVSNNSWGVARSGTGVELTPAIWETAIETGLARGAGGTGIFYAFAAGNAGPRRYANLEGVTNHYGVTTVCAVTDQGEHAPYSEQGSNLWVCAPSGSRGGITRAIDDRPEITTTDNDDVYTDGFNGTSAATPIVSGVAALVRSANTALTWRDVKLILAASARKNDADDTGWEDGALKYGTATDRYHFNHKYGFGVVDARAAVDVAAEWTTLPTFVEQKIDSAATLNLSIPDCADPSGCPTSTDSDPVSSSLPMGAEVEFIEFVDINVNLNHTRFRDLWVELVSPSGKVSVLSVLGGGSFSPLMGSVRFGSARHLGENPAGTWTLRLRDAWNQNTGTLNSWSLTVYGHRSTPGAPTLDSLAPGYSSLAVAWTAPTNPGASAVTGYEVRYIETTADETDDANWTEVDTGWTAGGALAYTLSGLEPVGYDVQVRAVNAQGDGVWSSTLAETPLSDAPSFADGATTTRSVAETAMAGTHVGAPVAATDPNDDTLTYTLSGADAASFAIDSSSGQLSVASGTTFDYETKTSYAVTVTAADPATEHDPIPDSDSIAVTVTVTDAPGTVTVSSTRPLVGRALTATVTDPDAPVSGLTWRWERSEDGTTWEVLDEATAATYTPSANDLGHHLRVTASYTDADGTAKEVMSVQTERVGRPSTGGGGGSRPRDDHGNSAGRATRVSFSHVTPWTVITAGRINTRSDRDYFRLSLPWAGVFVVETSGSSDTQGSVWQAGAELATATRGGERQNFRLSVPVEAGEVVIAVAGEQGRTGAYRLSARLIVGYVENPASHSFQSGIGIISGWVCEAEGVVVEIKKATGEVVELAAAYGTERADTAAICGDTDNGFGVLFNWNLLGDGTHEVVVLVDGIELSRAAVTVTTLGAEFVEGLQRSFLVADFPRAGEQVRVVWQESQQNFVLAPAELGATLTPVPSSGGIEGVLENPRPASFQSGIGIISGWVCEADEVVIEIDGQPIAAAAGTERGDTLDVCGDVDTGFGLLVNWAEFGAGAHEVVALVDGVELSRATVTVTLVDATAPFVRGLAKRVELAGFPTPEETVTVEWQESQQNFVITGVD